MIPVFTFLRTGYPTAVTKLIIQTNLCKTLIKIYNIAMSVKYFRHFSTYPLLFHVMISSSTETLADYSATASLFVSQPEPSSVPSPSSFSSDDAQPSTSTGSEKYDFRCYICGYCSNMRARFSYHMNLHTGTKPFQCKICLQSHNHKICMFTAKPLCPKVSCISLYLQCSTVGATCFDAKDS